MLKVHAHRSDVSYYNELMQDTNFFAFLCECIVLDQFETEYSPHITIESLKSDVKNCIKTKKEFADALCRIYEVKDVDEILEKILSGLDFLKTEDKFEEFMDLVWYENFDDDVY